MGLIRGIGKAVGGFLFTTFLIFSILMMALIQLTEYNSLKSTMSSLLLQQIDTKQIEQIYPILSMQCANRNTVELPYGEEKIILKCSDIKSKEDLQNLVTTSFFDGIYYKKYDCGFIECLQQPGEGSLLVLLSFHAHNFFKGLQYTMLIGTGIGAIIMLVSIESWPGRLKGFGTSLLVTGLPYFVFNYLVGPLIQKSLPIQISSAISPTVNKILSLMSTNFLIILVIGIVLTVTGYIVVRLEKKEKPKKKKK